MKLPLVLDVETTITNKGNAYTESNRLIRIGVLRDEFSYECLDPDDDKEKVQYYLDNCSVIVGFNLKFDLAWLRRWGYSYDSCRVWDCQLAEFLLGGQTKTYPSLNGTAEQYNLGSKLDIVAEEYWKKGIDTDQIPLDILDEYLIQDLVLTYKVYKIQEQLIRDQGLWNLFSLQCQDLLVLLDMEYNGMLLDVDKSEELAKAEETKIVEYEKELQAGYEEGRKQ